MSMETFDPNQAENLPEIEKQIAVRCVEHAQTYWNLLEKIKGSKLRMTKYDDEIMADFEAILPEVFKDDKAISAVNEDEMKSNEGKKKWREFIAKYEKKMTRFQFYVFEIARCRRGMNDWVYEQAQKAKASSN
ncbi:hypothetical protein MPSI1_003668 [Malassezia psittaci]|uniref:Polysaccharide biosynthesis domain-containing protein n=1 Tax=Malassezia psittaci TaxID=1821823 RepID=A0AAF0FI73_9BASI|nr:hypothetical protein MPSI1_003668 [Malassezia psittaci]